MSKRYTRLYELPGGLYAAGAPVVIRAGAMLKDARSRNVVVQLKFFNLSPKPVRGLTVALDFPERQGESVTRMYAHLRAEQYEEFGQNKALLVPSRSVHSFSASVSRVDFVDGSFWENEGRVWESIPKARTLEEAYGGEDVAEQFRAHYGTDCVYAPEAFGRFWQCTCGMLNSASDKACRRCQRNAKAFLSIDIDALRAECEAIEPEEKPQPRRTKRGTGWLILLLLIGVGLIAAIIHYTPVLFNTIKEIPSPTPTADVFVTQTPEIYDMLTPSPPPTPSPTLSPEQLQKQEYLAAVELLNEKSYSEARAVFLRLGSYGDSQKLAQEAVYRKAMALLDFIRTQDERDIYALLSMEERGTNRFSFSKDKALALGTDAVSTLRAACGGDRVDVTLSDTPSGTLRPLAACVKDLFLLLDGYEDSLERLAELEELTDYKREFYMLLEAGDIYGAYDWLLNYNGEFSGKDNWLKLLDLYKPYCGDWGLYMGDPTLIPISAQRELPVYYFNSRVIINGDYATLRLLFAEGEAEYYVDLTADTGSVSFLYEMHGVFYFAALNNAGNFAYMKYYDDGMQGSVEYDRMA